MRRKPPEECVSAGSCHLFPGGVGIDAARGVGAPAGMADYTTRRSPPCRERLCDWPLGAAARGAGAGIKTQGVKKNGRRAALFGGEEGIRTLERLNTFTRFPGVRLQPLIHLSVGEARIIVGLARKKQGAARSGALTFPFGPERLKTGESRKRGGAPAEAKSPLGARRLGRRAASAPHLFPLARGHALATLSPRSRHALAARSARSCCSALVLSFPLPTPPSSPSLGQGCGAPYDLPPDYRKIATCAARRPARARLRAGSRAGAPGSIGGCSRIGWGVLRRVAAKPRRAANGSRGAGFRGRSA